MKRSKSSQNWLRRHFDDYYVKEAQKAGYRSRAVYKLLEIQEKDRILKPGMVVIDLGAAPGSWSEVAAPLIGKSGKIIAMDILDIDPIDVCWTIVSVHLYGHLPGHFLGHSSGH